MVVGLDGHVDLEMNVGEHTGSSLVTSRQRLFDSNSGADKQARRNILLIFSRYGLLSTVGHTNIFLRRCVSQWIEHLSANLVTIIQVWQTLPNYLFRSDPYLVRTSVNFDSYTVGFKIPILSSRSITGFEFASRVQLNLIPCTLKFVLRSALKVFWFSSIS